MGGGSLGTAEAFVEEVGEVEDSEEVEEVTKVEGVVTPTSSVKGSAAAEAGVEDDEDEEVPELAVAVEARGIRDAEALGRFPRCLGRAGGTETVRSRESFLGGVWGGWVTGVACGDLCSSR